MSKQEIVCGYMELFKNTPVKLFKNHYIVRMGVHLSLLPPDAETVSKQDFDLILSRASLIYSQHCDRYR